MTRVRINLTHRPPSGGVVRSFAGECVLAAVPRQADRIAVSTPAATVETVTFALDGSVTVDATQHRLTDDDVAAILAARFTETTEDRP